MLPRKMSLTGTGGLPVGGIGLGVPGLPPGGPSGGGGGLAGAGGLGTQASAPPSANAPGGLDPLAHLSGKNKETQTNFPWVKVTLKFHQVFTSRAAACSSNGLSSGSGRSGSKI